MTTHQPTGAVRESFGPAQQQAAAMAGPPPAWDARARGSRGSARWVGLAVASLAAGAVAAWFGVERWGGASPTGSANAGVRASAPAVHEPVGSASGHNGFAPPAAVPTLTPTGAAQPSLDVTRQAGMIRIVSTNASLADAVRALAQATHTQVRGTELLASIATPVTLRWQGNDPAAAWDALLGRFASTAVSCSSTACEVWIVSANAPRNAAGASVNGSTATSEPAPPPVATPRPAAPPPSSEENTETN